MLYARCTAAHSSASLAISASANVKAIQRMVGQAAASMTLDAHADLFDDVTSAPYAARSRPRIRRMNS